ncbi:hypothetical protein AA103196_2051 [Ameyamaea chiangmaiensis NBRC 103196]|uniref:UPF0102 protein HUK82_00520 n=1 Tax=Ameyamaea chiangmaiensis TaxID=442969 RepID=A0A850P8N7_9PROT|nr:YraN family protein [Ameyamaea chiangmaiensis]MBS4073683.1 YraN family protein [Ameyamaea chiangmaiensis]NVN39049.1 YraN family protein [Ameyamaea chiangmaiensis]GBQ68824.1 hypothetical protein AA103196_2051 [Ameyamaea chiangmaiensis NBRC 103196]
MSRFTRLDRPARGALAYRRGARAEERVANALAREGWTILDRRVRMAGGEIDIIATYGTTLAFIEVKARQSAEEAAFALGPAQQARLVEAARHWLAQHEVETIGSVRFDVVTVDKKGAMRRIADAFREI